MTYRETTQSLTQKIEALQTKAREYGGSSSLIYSSSTWMYAAAKDNSFAKENSKILIAFLEAAENAQKDLPRVLELGQEIFQDADQNSLVSAHPRLLGALMDVAGKERGAGVYTVLRQGMRVLGDLEKNEWINEDMGPQLLRSLIVATAQSRAPHDRLAEIPPLVRGIEKNTLLTGREILNALIEEGPGADALEALRIIHRVAGNSSITPETRLASEKLIGVEFNYASGRSTSQRLSHQLAQHR